MEYNIPKSVRQLTELKMYAELIGNYKKYGIKSLYDNMTDIRKPSKITVAKFPSIVFHYWTGTYLSYRSGD